MASLWLFMALLKSLLVSHRYSLFILHSLFLNTLPIITFEGEHYAATIGISLAQAFGGGSFGLKIKFFLPK